MKLNERIALAKAGYKKADIEKMLDAEEVKGDNAEDKEVIEEVKTEDNTENNNDVVEDTDIENVEETTIEDSIKDNIIEELQGKVLELEKQLKNAQVNNINTNRVIENPIEKAEKKLYDTIANFS